MMSDYTLRARWVLPIDAPPLEGGYVSVSDGVIADVCGSDPSRGPVADLGDVVLLPGLVNAHTHLEFSGLAKPLGAPGMSLPTWIRTVIADRGRGDRDAAAAIAAGLHESAAAGVTTIGEIATSPTALYDVDQAPRSLLFQEAIGFSAGRVESVAAEMEWRVEAAGDAAGISPHAPYTVHPQLLTRLVDLAISNQLPIAMHLAESREELQLLRDGTGPFQELLAERSMWDGAAIPRGSRPLDYLRQLTRAQRSLAIHGNYFDAEEIAFAGAQRERISVVYCPRTHAYFGHEPYPLEAMLAAGVRVALGTDSRASNPDLNLLREVQFGSVLFPRVDPAVLLRMATLDAAEALGLGDVVGSITVGKRAELVTVRCDDDFRDPYAPLFALGARLTSPGT
jgi:cytosine/adenosine deaminase-related metal-dependent hydrolase